MTDEFISFDLLHPKPLLIVISGPSVVGKDTVIHRMKARSVPFHFVVTTTSRAPRSGEVNGVDYNFITHERFEEMIRNNELIEWALVYKDLKGIPRAQVQNALASGTDVILRVDVQGAARIRQLCPDALLIFLIPANYDEWRKRILERKTESEDDLRLRLETAREELKRMNEFDYVVVNAQNRLDETVDKILAIITAEHHRVNPRKITL